MNLLNIKNFSKLLISDKIKNNILLISLLTLIIIDEKFIVSYYNKIYLLLLINNKNLYFLKPLFFMNTPKK